MFIQGAIILWRRVMYQRLIDEVNNSDMILVGIGNGVGSDIKFNLSESHTKAEWIKYKLYSDKNFKEKSIDFYNKLEVLLKNKNYFVITTNFDGYIWESNINPIRIVAPCGNINRLQCGCEGQDGLVDATDAFFVKDKLYICDKCQKEYVPNVFNKEYYNEEGYLRQWNLYNKWLQGTLNKKLLVMEIGCDFSMFSIIRLPFEKIVMINQKAAYYRINSKFPQITAELKDRMISLSKNPFEFIECCCSIL